MSLNSSGYGLLTCTRSKPSNIGQITHTRICIGTAWQMASNTAVLGPVYHMLLVTLSDRPGAVREVLVSISTQLFSATTEAPSLDLENITYPLAASTPGPTLGQIC